MANPRGAAREMGKLGSVSASVAWDADILLRRMSSGITVPELVAGMRAHQKSAKVQEAACKALSDSCSRNSAQIEVRHLEAMTWKEREGVSSELIAAEACDENVREQIAEVGGVKQVILAMEGHRQEAWVQEEGCRALGTIAMGSTTRQTLVADLGGLCQATWALEAHPSSPWVQASACHALWALVDGHPRNQTMLLDAGGRGGPCAGVLAAMTQHRAARVQENACAVVRFLARHGNQNMCSGTRHRIKGLVLAAIKDHGGEAGMMEQGLWALSALADPLPGTGSKRWNKVKHGLALARSRAETGASPPPSTAGSGREGIQEEPLQERLLSGGQQTTEAAGDQPRTRAWDLEALEQALLAIERHRAHAGVQAAACSVLTRLASSSSAAAGRVAASGGIDRVTRLSLREHLASGEVQLQACALMCALAHDAAAVDAFVEAGALERLVSILTLSMAVREIVEVAMAAMHVLAHGDEGRHRLASEAGGIAAVVAAMARHSACVALQESACAVREHGTFSAAEGGGARAHVQNVLYNTLRYSRDRGAGAVELVDQSRASYHDSREWGPGGADCRHDTPPTRRGPPTSGVRPAPELLC